MACRTESETTASQATDSQAADSQTLVLAGPHHGITVTGAKELESFLFELIPDWPRLTDETEADQAAIDPIAVKSEDGHWRISSPHVDLEEFDLDDGYMVANTLIGALIAGYVAQDENLASLHAGAVRIGDGLIIMLGDNLSGKSTFSTVLAARGQKFFTDDRIVLDLSTDRPAGRSLAIAPKLRLPLPEEADEDYRDFVDDNSLLTWPEMTVLRLAPDLAAEFGGSLPITAIVHLRRDTKAGQPTLTTMPRPAMILVLLEQIFAPHFNQQGELAACVRLAGDVDCWQLDYASAFDAAETLIAHFS